MRAGDLKDKSNNKYPNHFTAQNQVEQVAFSFIFMGVEILWLHGWSTTKRSTDPLLIQAIFSRLSSATTLLLKIKFSRICPKCIRLSKYFKDKKFAGNFPKPRKFPPSKYLDGTPHPCLLQVLASIRRQQDLLVRHQLHNTFGIPSGIWPWSLSEYPRYCVTCSQQ